MGVAQFLLIYFGSLIGGNLFAMFIRRNHAGYTAVGASGAISGLIFASIALFPDMSIGFILLPMHIPGWFFGLLYVLYSIYGIKSQKDNIGHEAHLGGGIVGLLIVLLLKPEVISINTLPVILILIPSAIFLYILIRRPWLLMLSNPFKKQKDRLNIDDKYNEDKHGKEKELNKLLDKINERGMESLTEKEKERLGKLSK